MGPEVLRGEECAAAVLCVALSGHQPSCSAQGCLAALGSIAAAATVVVVGGGDGTPVAAAAVVGVAVDAVAVACYWHPV